MTPTHLRLISFLEGLSFIVLLLIAYVLDMRQFVRYAGMAHGALFLLFLIALICVRCVSHTNKKNDISNGALYAPYFLRCFEVNLL